MVTIVEDLRLHDFRRAHASQAIMDGENLHVAGRLQRQRAPSTGYAYLDDAILGQSS